MGINEDIFIRIILYIILSALQYIENVFFSSSIVAVKFIGAFNSKGTLKIY